MLWSADVGGGRQSAAAKLALMGELFVLVR